MLLFLFSALLLGISFALIQNTAPISHDIHVKFVRPQTRVILARMLFLAGLLLMSAAIIAACLSR
ncbi:MAG TPA: hypothetical protein VIN06_20410 [Devosia sp.]